MLKNNMLTAAITATLSFTTSVGSYAEQFQNVTINLPVSDPSAPNSSAVKLYPKAEFDFLGLSYIPAPTSKEGTPFATELFGSGTSILPTPNTETGEYMAIIYTIYGTIDKDFEMTFTLDKGRFADALLGIRSIRQNAEFTVTDLDTMACTMSHGNLTNVNEVFRLDSGTEIYQVSSISGGFVTFWQLGNVGQCSAPGAVVGTTKAFLSTDPTESAGLRWAGNVSTGAIIVPATSLLEVTTGYATIGLSTTKVASTFTPGWRYICAPQAAGSESSFANLFPVFEVKGTTTVAAGASDGLLVSVLPATTVGTGGNSFGGFTSVGQTTCDAMNDGLYRVNVKEDTTLSVSNASSFIAGRSYKFDGGGTDAVAPYSNVHKTVYRVTATDTTKNTITVEPALQVNALLHGEFAYDTEAFTSDAWNTENAVAATVVGKAVSDAVNNSSFSILLKASTPGLALYQDDQIMLLYKLTELGALATANEVVKMKVDLKEPLIGLPVSPTQELIVARSIQEQKPKIDVQGKGISIPHGDTTPNLIDNTDFGSVSLGSSPAHFFTIHNTGGGTLKINDINLLGTGCTSFSKVFPSVSDLGPHQSTFFQVIFISSNEESSDCTVSIDHNDNDENPYTFNLTGKGYDSMLFPSNPTLPSTSNLGITIDGTGAGRVSSEDKQIDCTKTGGTCQATYNTGAIVTLLSSADPGSYFSSWGGHEDCADAQVQMLKSLSCTAYFSKKPSELTISKVGEGSVTGGGIHCGEDCTENYLSGTEVTLTATPTEGWQLTRWSDGCSGTELQTQVTMNAATTCTATFEQASDHTLTIQKSGSGTGVVTASLRGTPTALHCGDICTEQYLYGSLITLKATPEADSKFVKWSGEGCGDTIQLTEDKTCHAEFSSLVVPYINVWQTAFDFEAPSSTSQVTQIISIYSGDWLNGNTLSTPLQLGTITVDHPAFVLKDTCSNNELAPWHACHLEVEFHPQSTDPVTATLSIPSDAPDTPIVTISLKGSVCAHPSQPSISLSPTSLDFGTQSVGSSTSLTISMYTSTQGQTCGMPQIDTVQLTGAHASEFSFKDQECYHGQQEDNTYSFCRGVVVFSPTSRGQKEVQLNLTFNNPTLGPSLIPIQAQAIIDQARFEISPQEIDFGSVSLGSSSSKPITIKNTGDINLKLKDIRVSGSPSFNTPGLWNCYAYNYWWGRTPELPPDGQCQITAQFSPTEVGDQQGILTLTSNDPDRPTTQIPLNGKAVEFKDCSDNNITIESATSGPWGSGSTWNTGTPPTDTDVVRLKGGHTVTGIAYAKVKTLCIEPQAILESPDDQGSPLFIRVNDYIQNKGKVRGKDGQDETKGTSSCTSSQTVGTPTCAQHGASISLQVDSYWWWGTNPQNGLIVNEGSIIAGNGGAGTQYGGQGGRISINGKGVLNLSENDESGVIRAGKGGDLIGTQAGQAGSGGDAQVSGYRVSGNGGLFMAGNGGNCNPNATVGQIGGNGGTQRWWGSTVNLQGTFLMGKGGTHCLPLGTDGREGFFQSDPGVISLSGSHTRIEGGNVTIFGGKDWVLNLSNLDHPVVQASGDITLAVGEGGMIDLRGSNQIVLEAQGQVTLFSNSILLDEGKRLNDVIAAQNIIVAPSKILRDVSLTASEKVMGSPATTVPVTIVLNNSGPEQDTYVLKVTDSKGWPLEQLSETVTVEGLSAVQMAFHVTLPTTRGEMNRIEITATSQADPQVSITKEVHVGVAMSDAEVMIPILPQATSSNPPSSSPSEDNTIPPAPPGENISPPSSDSEGGVILPSSPEEIPLPPSHLEEDTTPPVSPPSVISIPEEIPSFPAPVETREVCPSTGMINRLCDNRNRVIKDATLGPRAILSGGKLAGTIHSQGFVSQVTIQPDTELSGGTLSGYLVNQGTLRDFTFVGVSIRGGTLAGRMMNLSRVGGTLIDVTFAPHAHLQGGKLQGKIQGDKEAPALLENVKILKGSELSGVTFGQGVLLESDVKSE